MAVPTTELVYDLAPLDRRLQRSLTQLHDLCREDRVGIRIRLSLYRAETFNVELRFGLQALVNASRAVWHTPVVRQMMRISVIDDSLVRTHDRCGWWIEDGWQLGKRHTTDRLALVS